MIKKVLYLLILVGLVSSASAQNRYWVSPVAGNWSGNNWSSSSGGAPDGGGPPIATENALFDANGVGNCNIDVATPNITDFIVNGFTSTIDINGNTLTATGTVTLNTGTITDGLGTDSLVVTSTQITTFSGTTVDVVININSQRILTNGSIFNQRTIFNKSGSGDANGLGGNVFNAPVTLINSGTNSWTWANTNPDDFNGTLTIQNLSGNGTFLAQASAGNTFDGDVIIESSASGVYFGNGGGTAVLSTGNTVSIGSGGFTVGTLRFRNFTQSGATAQSLTLSGTAILDFRDSEWSGNVIASAPQVLVRESTFNGTTALSKTGAGNNNSYGGNTFVGDFIMNNSGSGTFLFGNNAADSFNGNVTLNNSGTSSSYIAQNNPGHTIGGDLIVNETGGGNSYSYIANSATSAINITGNVTLNLNGSGSNDRIYFGDNGDITVGGTLTCTNTSSGTSNYIAVAEGGNSFVNVTGLVTANNLLSTGNDSRIYLANSGDAQFDGGIDMNNGSPANSGFIMLAYRTGSDVTVNGDISAINGGASVTKRIFVGANGDLTVNGNTFLSNNSTASNSTIYAAHSPNGVSNFNGDITVECYGANTDGVYFGEDEGFTNFQAGRTISIGPNGFNAGLLEFRNFTQAGATPINITLTGTATLENRNARWGGTFDATVPRFLSRETTYSNEFTLEKTGAGDDAPNGANRFLGNAIINNSGSGYIRMANSEPDTFDLDLTLNNTGSRHIYIAYSGIGNRVEGKLKATNNGTGTSYLYFASQTASDLVVGDSVIISNVGSGDDSRVYFGDNGDITANGPVVMENLSSATESNIYVADGLSSQININGNSTFTNDATSTNSRIYLSNTGDANYNGNVSFENASNSLTRAYIYISNGDSSTTVINGDLAGINSSPSVNANSYIGNRGDVTINGNTDLINSSGGNTSVIYLNLESNSENIYNGNVVLESTNPTGDGIRFGQNGGSGTLTASHTVTIGALGFVSGELRFRNFTQVGATSQSLTTTGTNRILLQDSDWGGDVDFSAPRMNTRETNYRGLATLSKTGASDDNLFGGNKFFGNTIINNNGSGYIRFGAIEPDTFLLDLTINHATSSRNTSIGYSSAGNVIGGNVIVNHTGTGNGNVYLGNNAIAEISIAGDLTLNSNPILGDGRIYAPSNGQLSVGGDLIAENNAVSPTSYIYLSSAGTSSLEVHGNTTITNQGVGTTKRIYVGNNGDIVFNGTVAISNNSAATNSQIYVGTEPDCAVKFNENVVIENTTATSDGVLFGNRGGSDTLAAGKTITIGAGGFVAGQLTLRNFIQLGTTPQSLTATGTTQMLHYDSDWGGSTLDFSSPGINSRGTTFNGITSFSKTGAGNNDFYGDNTYVMNVTINNSGSGRMRFGSTIGDVFGGDVTVNHSASQETSIAYNSAGNSIAGNLVMNHNGTSNSSLFCSNAENAAIVISGNTVLNNTSTAGGSFIYFGNSGDVSLNGNLTINNVSTGSSGEIRVANSASSLVVIDGSTDVLNSQAGTTKRVYLSNNGRTIQNGVFTAVNSATATNSQIYIGQGSTASVRFEENVVISATQPGTGGIFFGGNNGNDTLADGKTITIGGGGFISGDLYLRNFVQLGTTAQSLTTTGTSTMTNYDSEWGGNVDFSAPRFTTRGTTYSGTATLTKTGASDDGSVGGNLFAMNAILNNSGSGYFLMGNGQPDIFSADLTMNNIGSRHMYLAHNSAGNSVSGNLLINNNSTGASYIFISTTTASTLSVDGTATINNLGTGASTRIYLGDDGDVTLNSGLTIVSNPTGTDGYVYIADGANSSVTVNGNTSIDCDGATSLARAYIGNSGDVVFNGDLEVINRSGVNSSQFYLNHNTSSINNYNGNITIENPNASSDGILFGNGGGAGILADTYTISIGALGFSGNNLFFRNFDQIGATPQTLITGSNAIFTLYDCEWGGNVDFSSRGITTRGSVYNGTTLLTKTGTSSSDSYGDNTYNGDVTFTNNSSSRMRLANNVGDDYNANATFVKTGGSFDICRNGTNTFAGNLTINSTTAETFGAGNGIIEFDGNIAQSINSANSNEPIFRRLVLNNTLEEVSLNTPIAVSLDITFSNGNLITTDANLLSINNNATATGANDNSYVYGPVEKIGNDAFTFPVGDSGLYRPIGISAPSSTGDRFEARYFEQNTSPQYVHSRLLGSLGNVSSREYWILDRTNGTSNVEVTLSWNTNSGGVGDLAELRVARWNGTDWDDHGNGGTTGNLTTGTIVSSAPISTFSPFTLGSTSFAANPLPIELISFEAIKRDEVVELTWETATEINNDFFTIERTLDGEHYQVLETIKGAGNSNVNLSYKTIDPNPYEGTAYYRLKQTDYDGQFEYSDLVAVRFNDFYAASLNIFPNPVTVGESLFVEWKGPKEMLAAIRITTLDGKVIKEVQGLSNGSDLRKVVLQENIPAGVYVVNITTDSGESFQEKLIVR